MLPVVYVLDTCTLEYFWISVLPFFELQMVFPNGHNHTQQNKQGTLFCLAATFKMKYNIYGAMQIANK